MTESPGRLKPRPRRFCGGCSRLSGEVTGACSWRNTRRTKHVGRGHASCSDIGWKPVALWARPLQSRADSSRGNPVGIDVGENAQRNKKRVLRVASIEFVPAPDLEKRLAHVYDLLLTCATEVHPENGSSASDRSTGSRTLTS